MSDTKTDRPLTPAESRALDALVEWRRLDAAWDAAWEAGVIEPRTKVVAATHAMRDAAGAVIAEREVQRG